MPEANDSFNLFIVKHYHKTYKAITPDGKLVGVVVILSQTLLENVSSFYELFTGVIEEIDYWQCYRSYTRSLLMEISLCCSATVC